MNDFEYKGFFVCIKRTTIGNYFRRSYSFFSAYNPNTKQTLKGRGGKRKAKETIEKNLIH